MLDKDEIANRLQGVPRTLCVAFAARAALRVLALLAATPKNRDPFWYWTTDDRPKHLLAVLTAQRFSLAFFAADGAVSAAANAADAAYSADHNSFSPATDNAAYNAVSAAVSAATYNAASAAVFAANAAYNAGGVKDLIQKAIEADMKVVTNHLRGETVTAIELLNTPLWHSGKLPKALRPHWKRFTRWALSLDAGFEHWLGWVEDRVAGKPLDLDLLKKQVDTPEEIKAQGPKAVNAYLASLESITKPLNLVRAIFIGNGASGKTSLIRVLNGENVVAGKEEMTPGIEIRHWPVGDTGITAKFWDFGGQVMSHATHQFFLRERCLYVLVLNARAEINANEEAEYWLEHVKAFGKNAPVMLVGNKDDVLPVHLDMRALCEKYPNIVGFYPFSCTEAARIKKFKNYLETFKDDFIEKLQSVGTHQIYFTDAQFAVLKAVQQKSPESAFLPQDEFDGICERNGIGTEGAQNRAWLLDLLDKLGEVIHFPDIIQLNGFVLNPRWLTYGVYTLLYSGELDQNRGTLSEAEVVAILDRETVKDEKGNVLSYPKDKCAFIIEAMRKFKLCYPLPGETGQLVIPDKLSPEQPELTFDSNKAGTLAFEFDFKGFLPRHVMPTFIVTFHEDIHSGLVWQNGVILKNERTQATARVQVDYHKRVFNIWVQGTGRREMLAILSAGVTKILNRMEHLEYEEKVILPISAQMRGPIGLTKTEKAPYRQLIATARAGQRTYISKSGAKYDSNRIMGEIMTEEKQKEERVTINQTFNAPVGAVGVGDHNQVTGTATQNRIEIKTAAAELDKKLEDLMLNVMSADGDAKTKMAAYDELKSGRDLLQNTDSTTPEQRTKLKQFLGKIKTGGLGAFGFLAGIKKHEPTIAWIMEKASGILDLLQPVSG